MNTLNKKLITDKVVATLLLTRFGKYHINIGNYWYSFNLQTKIYERNDGENIIRHVLDDLNDEIKKAFYIIKKDDTYDEVAKKSFIKNCGTLAKMSENDSSVKKIVNVA